MSYVVARCAGVLALGCCLAVPVQAQSPENPPSADADVAQDERRLDIFNYRVEGNTVLSRMEVEAAVLPFLGPQRKVSDVEDARLALIKAYHDKGYETVDVQLPPQDGQGGVIRLQVTEYKVSRLRVTGSRYYSPEDIRKQVPSLAEGAVPNYKAVSADIAAVNTSADRLITPTLKAGDTPGTVDVDLNVEDALPLHGSLEINDRASARTKRLRVAASIGYNNLFQRSHSLNLQTQFVPEETSQSLVVSASYVAPVPDTPFTVVGYAVHSDSDVAALGDINVLGAGNILGLRGIFSKVTGEGEAAWVHQLTAGIDYKDFSETLAVDGKVDETPIDYVPLSLQYSLAQRTAKRDIDLSLGVNLGLRGWGATNEEFGRKRYGASANWVTLRGDIGYVRRYDNDWRLGARLAAHYAGKPTISNEQFSAGGLDSVRGYYEGQDLGDDGASVQLQVDMPSFHKAAGAWLNEGRLFVFTDAAALRIYEPLGGQEEHKDLASIGLGLTLKAFERLNASILVAEPLVKPAPAKVEPGDPPAEAPEKMGARVQFRVWTDF